MLNRGSKGLNDIQFFRGCEEGCKYDPFLPANQLPISEVLKVAKVGTIDQALMGALYWQAPLTLSISKTVKDFESTLYMADYICNLLPSMIDNSNDFFSRKQLQTMLHLTDKYELSLNTYLRQGALIGKVMQRVAWFGMQMTRISMDSKTQNVKRDADRELLQRYLDSLTYKIRMTSRIYEHTEATPPAGKKFIKRFVICDETIVTLNRLTSDLLTGAPIDLKMARKDFDIITSYL